MPSRQPPLPRVPGTISQGDQTGSGAPEAQSQRPQTPSPEKARSFGKRRMFAPSMWPGERFRTMCGTASSSSSPGSSRAAPRPTESDELERGGAQCGIKLESTAISRGGFLPFSQYLQGMTQLQMRIRGIGIELDRLSVDPLGLCHMSDLLQSVAVLHPYRGVARVSVERLSVMPGRQFPLSCVSGAIRQRDQTGFVAPEAQSRQPQLLLLLRQAPETCAFVSEPRDDMQRTELPPRGQNRTLAERDASLPAVFRDHCKSAPLGRCR
jgi:hypothetical protein